MKGNTMKMYGYCGAVIFGITYAQGAQASVEEFRRKYEVDAPLKEVLDAHAQEIGKTLSTVKKYALKKHGVWTFDWLPGYFVKYNLARIYGMEKMKRAIEAHNLDLIRVPDKRIYHVKGRPETLDSYNYAIIIKKVLQAKNVKPMNLEQAKQLCTLINATKYCSMAKSNYIRTANNTLTMIDTESTFDADKIAKGFMRLIGGGHDLHKDYSPEALRYILNELVKATSRAKYREVYQEAQRNFAKQVGPTTWNYASYFNELMVKKHNR